MKCTVRTRNSFGVTRVLSSSLLKDQRSYGESGQCECIKHSCPDSQREGLSGCGRGGSAACLLTDPCGSRYSCWRHVISGMQCENRAWGTWAWLPCSRATAVRWKPISRPRVGPYRVWMRLLLRSAAAGTHVPCQNTLLLQNEETLVPKLLRMVLKYMWSTSGFCNRNIKASYKYSIQTVFLATSFSLEVCLLFPFLLFVSKNNLLGGTNRWYPKESFVCSLH